MQLTPQQPWPGLDSFSEDAESFFFGRSDEIQELQAAITSDRSVLLAGSSGLGKSSLLKAGLFPSLRRIGFIPIYIRLHHSAEEPAYRDQVIRALQTQAAFKDSPPQSLPPLETDEPLVHYFNRSDLNIWSTKYRLLTPVLVFDQFEEIFTRPPEVGRAEEAERFLTEIADLAENRIPTPARQESSPDEEAEMDAVGRSGVHFRLILSMRKEYLAELEAAQGHRMPSLLNHRLYLWPMTGDQAREAVTGPAREDDLVDPSVVDPIVRFVSRSHQPNGNNNTPVALHNLKVEPAILSLVCAELNRLRLNSQEPGSRITRSLLDESKADIVKDFLDETLNRLPTGSIEGARQFLFDLVTSSGNRSSMAVDALSDYPGLSVDQLRSLENARVLRIEESPSGIRVAELIHDILAREIFLRKQEHAEVEAMEAELARQKEQARRARRRYALYGAGLIGLAVIAILLVWIQSIQKQNEIKELSRHIIDAYRSGLESADASLVRFSAERLLQSDPLNPAYLSVLADANAQLQDWDGTKKALEKWKQARSEEPLPHSALALEARLHESRGSLDEAIETWRDYLQSPALSRDEEIQGLVELARLYRMQENWNDLRPVLDRLDNLTSQGYRLERALTNLELGLYEAALADFEAAAATIPPHPDVETYRGKFRQVEESLAFLKQVKNLPPLEQALAYQKAAMDEEALEQFQEAFRQGTLQGNSAADASLKKLASGMAEQPEAWVLYGKLKMEQANWTAAINAFSRAIEISPNPAYEALRTAAFEKLNNNQQDPAPPPPTE